MHNGQNAESTPFWGYFLANSPLSFVYKGTSAVFLFFALSGYVLTHSICSHDFRRRYVVEATLKRYLRLGGPVLAAAVFGGLILNVPLPEIAREALYGSMLFGQSTSNAVLWTISYELYGSLLIFLLAALFASFRTALVVLLLVSSEVLINSYGDLFYYSLFMAGMALRLLQDWVRLPKVAYLSGMVVGLYLMSYSSFSYAHQPMVSLALALERTLDYHPNWPAYFPALGSIVFLASVTQSSAVLSFLERQPFQWLGKHSYSFYLLHFPVLIVISRALMAYFGANTFSMVACLILTCATTFALAVPFYRYVDRTFTWVSGWLSKHLVRRLTSMSARVRSAQPSL